MGKDQWPDSKLRGASKILAYEWRMLRECHELLASESDLARTVRNALVEARLIHARALIAFCFDCKPRKGDIHVCRWFAPGSDEYLWFADHKHRCACWTEKSRIDKHLAHLTEERIGEILQQYKPDPIKWLDELMREFIELAGERVAAELLDQAEALKSIRVSDHVSSTKDNREPDVIRSQGTDA